MIAIMKKDFYYYFMNSSGYIYLSAFFIGTGLSFFLVFNDAKTINSFNFLFILTIFFSPNITTDLFLKEKLSKTDKLIIMSPLSPISVVLGKYFSALAVHALACFFSLTYSIIILISLKYDNDMYIFVSQTIGTFLLGSSMISISLFIATLFDNKALIYLYNLTISSFLYIMDEIITSINIPFVKSIISIISFENNYNKFPFGIIDLKNTIFFLLISITFIFLTTYSVKFSTIYDE